jgi:cell division inhibitor SepF
MSIGRSLQKAVSRLAGTAEDEYGDEYDDGSGAMPEAPPHRYEGGLTTRHQSAARGSEFDQIYDQQSAGRARSSPDSDRRPLALVHPAHREFACLRPQSFDEARQIADRFCDDAAVIVDLRGCGVELSGRVIDFCSGLTYARGGGLQSVGEGVILLTPGQVELSGEGAAGDLRSGFFNRL